jgi:hypothetical protein
MGEAKTISGHWWINGRDKPSHGGVLTEEDGELTLKVVIPGGFSMAAVVQSASHAKEVPETIHGRDEQDKPIVLFGCFRKGHSISQGQEEYEIKALAAAQGSEIPSWHEPIVRSLRVRIQYLHRWLETEYLQEITLPDGTKAWTELRHDNLVFQITEGIQFRIRQESKNKPDNDGRRFSPECEVWLTFDTPRTLEETCDRWVHWIAHFFSLLAGTDLRCEEITISDVDLFALGDTMEDAMTWFDRRTSVLGRCATESRNRMSDPTSFRMLAPYSEVKEQLGQMLKAWYEVGERLDPVVNIFTTVVFHQSLYMTAGFLHLIQALEVYHAKSGHFASTQLPPDEHTERVEKVVKAVPSDLADWTRRKIQAGNYKYLNERLAEIFRANESAAKLLFGDIDVMAGKMAYTRNYFTHYGKGPDPEKFLTQAEIGPLIFKMEHFLWMLLLKEVGAPESARQKVLNRASKIVSRSLGRPKPGAEGV